MEAYELPKYGKVVRESILERDNHECQGCRIFEGCDRREPERIPARLEVHHILPQSYAEHLNFNPNYPENLITLCRDAHRGHESSVHPDMYQAGIDYNQGNKDAYKEASRLHKVKLRAREIFWNDSKDRQMTVQATRNTQNRRREGWRWVTDG